MYICLLCCLFKRPYTNLERERDVANLRSFTGERTLQTSNCRCFISPTKSRPTQRTLCVAIWLKSKASAMAIYIYRYRYRYRYRYIYIYNPTLGRPSASRTPTARRPQRSAAPQHPGPGALIAAYTDTWKYIKENIERYRNMQWYTNIEKYVVYIYIYIYTHIYIYIRIYTYIYT